MKNKDTHYYSEFPDAKVKIFTISESLRRHLYVFKTIPGVFSYKKLDLGTQILIKHMYIPEKPSVLLDLGCGYGPIGIVLKYESPESLVYLIDINRNAIWCAKENVKINLVNNQKTVRVFPGNYLSPVKNKRVKFDEIYMNPPLRQGRKVFLNLIQSIQEFIQQNGSFQFVIKKKMGAPYIFKYLKENYPNNHTDIICKRSGYWVLRFFA